MKQNWLTWTLSMGSFLDFAYQIGYRRTVKIYLDDDGVWIYSGIMPWNKGVSGVKWRDIDEALYFTGFFSWVAKSYRISIRHRFTKSREIALKDVKHGNVFVQKVNDNLKRKIDV